MEKYKKTIATWDTLAELYEDKFMELKLYDKTYDAFLKRLKVNAQVLEIGCGPGNITRYMMRSRPDLRWTGTDVSPAMVERAASNNPGAVFEVMDARALCQVSKKVDAIVNGFCIPYMEQKDVKSLLEESKRVLNPRGYMYLSALNGDYSDSDWQRGSSGREAFVHYYSYDVLVSMLNESGFRLVSYQEVTYELPQKTDIHHVFIVQK